MGDIDKAIQECLKINSIHGLDVEIIYDCLKAYKKQNEYIQQLLKEAEEEYLTVTLNLDKANLWGKIDILKKIKKKMEG